MNRLIFLSMMILIVISLNSCKGCSRSRHNNSLSEKVKTEFQQNISDKNLPSASKEIVIMKEEGGVYFVPIEINGVAMQFIFDTGASCISLSDTEAMFLLKQGKLKTQDIKGSQKFMDANGDISEGTRVNLREVKIGNKTIYNIEASVVHNQEAPLLFGQSAMNRFGKIIIDYENNEIIFN